MSTASLSDEVTREDIISGVSEHSRDGNTDTIQYSLYASASLNVILILTTVTLLCKVCRGRKQPSRKMNAGIIQPSLKSETSFGYESIHYVPPESNNTYEELSVSQLQTSRSRVIKPITPTYGMDGGVKSMTSGPIRQVDVHLERADHGNQENCCTRNVSLVSGSSTGTNGYHHYSYPDSRNGADRDSVYVIQPREGHYPETPGVSSARAVTTLVGSDEAQIPIDEKYDDQGYLVPDRILPKPRKLLSAITAPVTRMISRSSRRTPLSHWLLRRNIKYNTVQEQVIIMMCVCLLQTIITKLNCFDSFFHKWL